MKLVRHWSSQQPDSTGCALTIGNFDGVHQGHQHVLKQLADCGLPRTVVCFEPMPSEYFAGENAPPRLQLFREKFEDLQAFGLERLCVLRFDKTLADMPAQDFVSTVLVKHLGARHIAIGDDFRFGANRAGDYALLEAMSRDLGFSVSKSNTFTEKQARISSTRIRQVLGEGDVQTAQALLGKPYRISGKVQHGRALARTLGTPTANINVQRKPALRYGVYAVTVSGAGFVHAPAVANIGVKPTINGDTPLLEVHLLGETCDLYGQRLNVYFHQFIRAEQRFDSLEILKSAIDQDKLLAQECLNKD